MKSRRTSSYGHDVQYASAPSWPAPGKRTLTQSIEPIQRKDAPTIGPSADDRNDGPATPPPKKKEQAHDIKGRVTLHYVEGDEHRIKIGAGVDQGVEVGMPGDLVGENGFVAARFTVRDVRGNSSDATLKPTESEVKAYHLVVVNPSSGGGDKPVQRAANGDADPGYARVHELSGLGVSGSGHALPFLDTIQRSFGSHDVTGVTAHTDGAAAHAARGMGASAYATGDHIAFGTTPDLHTAAHEAAHVVQQRAGVHLKGGVGESGDVYERHADAVADLVVAGKDASSLLDEHAGAGATPAIQRKEAPAGGVIELSPAASDPYIKPLADAGLEFKQAHEKAELAYTLALDQANSKLIHKEFKADYKHAKEAREKALAKGSFMKVFDAVSALASIAGGVGSIVGAAKELYEAQKVMREASKTAKEMKEIGLIGDHVIDATKKAGRTAATSGAKKAIGEGAEGGGKIAEGKKKLAGEDPDTTLADHNRAAIEAGSDAADKVQEGNEKYYLLDIFQAGERGEQYTRQWNVGLTDLFDEGKVLSSSKEAFVDLKIRELFAGQAAFERSMDKLRSIWAVYSDDGYGALHDEHERSIIETIIKWKHDGDPRLDKIRYATDQSRRRMRFDGSVVETRNELQVTKSYGYTDELMQMETGLVYVSDPAVARALGLTTLAPASPWGEGAAETHADQLYKGATKYAVSISLCKALETLGLTGRVADAGIWFHSSSGEMKVEERLKGEAYDHWKDTAEFAEFWRKHLGGEYGYIKSKDGHPETFAAATPESLGRSKPKPADHHGPTWR